MDKPKLVLGLDPGLRYTGWGLVSVIGNRVSHVDNGTVATNAKDDLAVRLKSLHDGLTEVLENYRPEYAAVEETFVNKNPTSTLKLGMARGVVMLAPALKFIPVASYAPNRVKKSVVGAGHAQKEQVQMMVARLLPGVQFHSEDSADALAVALCHGHEVSTLQSWQTSLQKRAQEKALEQSLKS